MPFCGKVSQPAKSQGLSQILPKVSGVYRAICTAHYAYEYDSQSVIVCFLIQRKIQSCQLNLKFVVLNELNRISLIKFLTCLTSFLLNFVSQYENTLILTNSYFFSSEVTFFLNQPKTFGTIPK